MQFYFFPSLLKDLQFVFMQPILGCCVQMRSSVCVGPRWQCRSKLLVRVNYVEFADSINQCCAKEVHSNSYRLYIASSLKQSHFLCVLQTLIKFGSFSALVRLFWNSILLSILQTIEHYIQDILKISFVNWRSQWKQIKIELMMYQKLLHHTLDCSKIDTNSSCLAHKYASYFVDIALIYCMFQNKYHKWEA